MLLLLFNFAVTEPVAPTLDVIAMGGGGYHKQENWRDHVPSFVIKEQESERERIKQRRSAAILALSL